MPYVTQERRKELDPLLPDTKDWAAGDIVYGITRLVVRWLPKGFRFYQLCMGAGILTCALLEFYRRKVAPYEDQKIKEHGDCYE